MPISHFLLNHLGYPRFEALVVLQVCASFASQAGNTLARKVDASAKGIDQITLIMPASSLVKSKKQFYLLGPKVHPRGHTIIRLLLNNAQPTVHFLVVLWGSVRGLSNWRVVRVASCPLLQKLLQGKIRRVHVCVQ